MTTQTINEIWNYYLTLEGDIANTSRFIEPSGQENVHSFEFAKILILACTELESVFKLLCLEITGKQPEGTIRKQFWANIPVSWMQLCLLKGGEELSPLSKVGTLENFHGGTHTKK